MVLLLVLRDSWVSGGYVGSGHSLIVARNSG